ncbi:uncharacterized protein NECHADRAFT_83842 [Fusarium vanettenii 77-13-4]|uniref:Uncharacterized protein n=1 Tax=Fusarium vanettenii (strain ATCC MYA-4622 / CBS 123669 / FGSC 9596 / NRRL 45880 / 77-13-4) TaxID=660122 RepID=C7YYX9_FUSV7|nr:uncharacterized protein NECHADRAFT_83842 [Fusarium vanettenii 77-13-4]EEU43273.1 predicted protein [Fusarium vanettenii 77-13-4]
MSGAGYNDPEKLRAARELAMSFGNSSQPRGGGGGGGGSRQRQGNDFGNRAPRERYNYNSPPPPPPPTVVSNIPPPSRRNYTDTLVSSNVRRTPGQRLGSSTIDFLNRRTPTPQPTPQPTSANQLQEPPNQSAMAVVPPSVTNKPVNSVAQGQNGTDVSGNENRTTAPARADEGRLVDIQAETTMAMGTESSQPKTNRPMSAAPEQAQALVPGSLQNNNIASTWAASYNDSSDEEEEEEEGEIFERPKAEPSRKDVPSLPKADDEDLIMISPDQKPNTLYTEDISKSPLTSTGTANGISVQKVRKNIVPPLQQNGRGPVEGSSAINQTSRDQTRGPTNGHVLVQPHLDTPHHVQASPMQFPATPMTPGPSQSFQAGENKTAAPTEKQKAPRKTLGLKSSMWAS